jgi:hypothetical protein
MLLVRPRDAVTTYRCLRIAMPALVVLLAVSVADQALAPQPNCWLGSISAYYYTTSRAAFVASLCAIGACLVIYAGNTAREDFALNLSGMLAFVVAFVPTPLGELRVSPDQPSCQRSIVPTQAQLTAAVGNNMLALLATASVVLVIAYAFSVADGGGRPSLALVLMTAVVVAVWVLYAVDRGAIVAHAHLFAAVGMFAGMAAVVLLNSFPHRTLDPAMVAAPAPYRRTYRAILAAMVGSAVGFGIVAWSGRFAHTVFWLEAALIALFGVYWIVQSVELWQVTARAEADPRGPGQAERNGSAG